MKLCELKKIVRLNSYIELLTRNQFLQFLAHLATEIVGVSLIDQRRERIDRLAIEQDIELSQLTILVARAVVVERCVALRNTLQLVVEIEDDLRQRHFEIDLDAILRDEGLIFQHTSLVDTEFDHVTQEIGLGDDLSVDIRLLDLCNFRDFGQTRGVMHLELSG